jgi:hypothetical protein
MMASDHLLLRWGSLWLLLWSLNVILLSVMLLRCVQRMYREGWRWMNGNNIEILRHLVFRAFPIVVPTRFGPWAIQLAWLAVIGGWIIWLIWGRQRQ